LSSRAEFRQRGLASLEFVLVLPILLVITFLAVAIVKLGHLRLDMQISARNQAFEDVFGWKIPFLADIDSQTRWYVPGTTVTHPAATSTAGDNFYSASATTEQRFDILRANTTINPTAHASSTEYQAVRVLGGWRINVREQYAVVAVPLWERRQIPLGYDQYLYDELKDVNYVVPGIPGISNALNAIADIPLIDKVPGLGDIDDFDFSDLYSGYASDAVIDVFPRVNK
jgi:hypothetical protein